jgi:hypothetical protein
MIAHLISPDLSCSYGLALSLDWVGKRGQAVATEMKRETTPDAPGEYAGTAVEPCCQAQTLGRKKGCDIMRLML